MNKDEVEKALDELRPALQRDGGNVELVAVEDNVIKLRLVGACAGCPMSTMTLKGYIEKVLKEKFPDLKEVEAV